MANMATGQQSSSDDKEADDFFITMAILIARRSKLEDKVGVVVATSERRIVAYGYNGSPVRHSNSGETDDIDAHTNAIIFATAPLRECTMYTTHFPRSTAAATHICHAEIKQLIYLKQKEDPSPEALRVLKGHVLHKEVCPDPDLPKRLAESADDLLADLHRGWSKAKQVDSYPVAPAKID